ncbi:hypothetical protein P691DRAFT_766285 [Macrolepiota fuliginosa MF-IS2]|uniref:Uncharacterized protein n=1 Tax=Macrolepiota fuliginosa MF-IS2 TaxID=1400762 RepID=A0A9P5WYG9_9AGAR|nr:hypothetical protein P691DRAFT_766285 [Macrolepiota fuliginosa MF-IS2]
MATTPPPPPQPTMPTHAASMSSKPGPTPRPSFAEAVAKTLCPTAPPFMRGPPHAPQPSPKVPQGPVSSNGITCTTATVPSQSDLEIVKAMLPPKISGSQVLLPMSRSFIKIVDIPYFIPGTMAPPNGQEIGNQLIPSPIPVNKIKHVWFVRNSPKADSGTFWINLMDTQ